jgi:DNA polymerase V
VLDAAAKLRQQRQIAGVLVVFVRTNRFKDDYYSQSQTITLPIATNFTPTLLAHAMTATTEIYREGCEYKKAGVILLELCPEHVRQSNLLVKMPDLERQQQLMKTIDLIDNRWGQGTIRFAAQGWQTKWRTRSDLRSPRYTSCWNELMEAKAGFGFPRNETTQGASV